MKIKVAMAIVSLFIIFSFILASCTNQTSTSTSVPAPVTSSTVKPPVTSAATTTSAAPATAQWWDKWGTPQYGGTIVVPYTSMGGASFDNYSFIGADYQYWLETPFSPVDPTLDRQTWSYLVGFTPVQYCVGNLLENWEITDPETITGHVRQGIHWQDKAPVNGREFVASDIQAHYDRLMGTGGGFTQPAPMYIGMSPPGFVKATATDKYTIVFKFSTPTAASTGLQGLTDPFAFNSIEAPEWVALGGPPKNEPAPAGPPSGPPGPGSAPPPAETGPLNDWHNAVGTGPWMLTDYVDGSSMTFTKNPNYWAYDQRYPQNKLPYADELNILTMPDTATELAALRTGKIDTLGNVDWQQAAELVKTNPELQQVAVPMGATAVAPRNDEAPFTDIRVREALQMSLNLPEIAKSYFGGTVDGTPCWISPALKGYAFAYEDWPQSLIDEYSYNPTQAKQLLSDAGYPNGFKTDIVASPMYDVGLLQIIKSQFMDIGVDMSINMMADQGSFGAYVTAGKDDQMVAWGSAMIQDSMAPILSRYDANNLSLNWCHVNDPGYQAIVAKFAAATDPAEIPGIMAESDEYVLEHHFFVTTFATVDYNIWQPYLKGYGGEPWLDWGGTYMFARMWINQTAK